MKVLYWSIPNNLPANMVSDYQADMLFHGMRKLLGADCVDSYRFWWMYAKDKGDNFEEIWGKGFTMYGLLDEVEVDRTEQNFDKIIIPIHHSVAQYPTAVIDTLNKILKKAEGKQIAIVDGWDRDYINPDLLDLCRRSGVKYFKRELYQDIDGVWPINFAFPKEKIWDGCMTLEGRQTYDIAPLVPVNQSIDSSYMSTYIYDNEKDYYQMYRDSKFALTSKKGGWDTLRHYEILANRCVPLFVDINSCPKNCMWNYPKDLCKRALFYPGLHLNLKRGEWVPGMELPHCGVIEKETRGNVVIDREYHSLQEEFFTYFKENLTTEHLARYVLETMDD